MICKKNESRFSLQFDEDNPKHFNAIVILNEMNRNKANYIAELIWEKEYESDSNNQEEKIQNEDKLRKIIKECLLEVLLENKNMFSVVQNEDEQHKTSEETIILEQSSKDAYKYNKEVLSGLSCFGIKK